MGKGYERGGVLLKGGGLMSAEANILDRLPPTVEQCSSTGGLSLFDSEGRKKSQAALLIEIGKKALLFHDSSLNAYAEIEQDGVKSSMPIRSREFKEYLGHELYKLTEKGASSNAVRDAISTLEAVAKFDGEMKTVAVRVHQSKDYVAIDLGCAGRKIIKINKDGWEVVDSVPVKFIRKKGMTALPLPAETGSIDSLIKYLNIKPEELPLIYGWVLCALAGVKPYPVLVLQGEQGTGKSMTSRVIRSLVDPSAVPLRSPPKDTKDLLVSAANNHTVILDNLSGISPEMSDCLCRFSTGGGIDSRALYTDNEQNLIEIQRPVLVNGIDDIATRPDLAERALLVNLPVIKPSERKSESEFWANFEEDRPAILAGLLNGIVSGFKHRHSIKLESVPRMADVTYWVTACERDLGLEGQFNAAHEKNQQSAVEAGVESSPIGSAIMALMSGHERWSGNPNELMACLADIAGDYQSRSRAWPQSAKGLSNTIKRLEPNLRKMGVLVSRSRGKSGRLYTIERLSTANL